MIFLEPRPPTAYLDRVDPRVRVAAAVVWAVLAAAVQSWTALIATLAAAVAACAFTAVPPRRILGRLLALNAFLLVLVAMVAISAPGTPLRVLGPLCVSREGLHVGLKIALKANAIVLAVLVLLGAMQPATLGHALHHLHVPAKLVHLLLFAVRYLDVLRQEYRRLRRAVTVRGFRPRMNCHTYRTFGYLVGMLLVRSVDRAERILAAMQCRGFTGRFYLLDHFAFSRRDVPFVVAIVLAAIAVCVFEGNVSFP